MTRRPAREGRNNPDPIERFRPPVVTAHEIVRLRLLDRLTVTSSDDAPVARITLVRGPAGFGKTTLLAQAYRQVIARGQTAVWLDCSELDADPNHFLDSLYAAAASIGMDENDLEFTPADFAHRLARVDATAYLFLDEFERLAGTPVEEIVERLAAALPGQAHLVIASRQAPRSWFLKRELRGLAATIEPLDLRLTGAELRTLLNERFDADAVERIEQLTEGWPMAVQLARLRSRDTTVLRDLLGSLERGGLGLFEYLAERVVESLSEDQQRFLRDTAILPFVNSLAANALMQRDDGYALLSSVMHLQPIVTVTGDAELTIRLHPLFRQFMKDQLARSGQHRERDLHRCAAEFFAQRGRTSEAVQHSLEAGDTALAISLIDRAGGEELIFTIGPRKVQAILTSIPPAALDLSIRLRLAEVLMLAVDGRAAVVDVATRRLETRLDAICALPASEQPVPSPAWPAFARGLSRMSTAFMQDLYRGCADGSMLHTLEMDAYCRRHFAAQEAYLGFVLALGVLMFARHGNVRDARRYLEEYLALCERNGFAPHLPSINPQRGMIEFLSGNFEKAQMVLERSAELRMDHFAEPEVLLTQLCKALRAMILHEQGRLEEALVLIEGLRTDLDASLPEILTLSYRTRILCTEKLRSEPEADELLAEGMLHARTRDAQRLVLYLQALRLELLHRRHAEVDGDLDIVCEFLRLEIDKSDPSWLFLDQCLRAVVPPLIGRQRHQEAAHLAERICQVARAQGRRHLEAISLILLALAQMQTDRERATETLRQALALTSETQTIQPYVDLAPQLGQLMVAALAGRSVPRVADHVRAVLRALEGDPAAQSDNWKTLSERERDILLVLAAQASTKAAARALGLAPETVKHHLKRIYAKLGVHTREEALAQVARMGG